MTLMTQVLKSLDGKDLKKQRVVPNPGGGTIAIETDELLTLRIVCTEALMHPEGEDGNEKFARFQLAIRLNKEENVEFKAEEIVKLKQLIARVYGPLVVGRAYEILDGKS